MNKDKLVIEWIDHAKSDLNSARFLTKMEPEPLEIICYHCQQSAEKYLKALLVRQNINPGKTHDLNLLVDQLGFETIPDRIKDSFIILNDYSVSVRYPGYPDLAEIDRTEALGAADIIESFCLKILNT